MPSNQGKIDVTLLLRLIGATIGAVGLYLTAFQKPIIGAALIGIGGVLLALGGASS